MTFNDFTLLIFLNNILPETIADGVNWSKFPELGPVNLIKEKKNPFSETVRSFDGMSGYEDNIWKVFHIVNHDIYFKIEGRDNSYGESIWEKYPYEVKPSKKTITIYEKLKVMVDTIKDTILEIICDYSLFENSSNETADVIEQLMCNEVVEAYLLSEKYSGYDEVGEEPWWYKFY